MKTAVPGEKPHFIGHVISAFVHEFTKRSGVTYLAKDGLAPKHEEDDSAIRQMLKKFHTKQETGKTSPTAQPTETCFRLQSQTKLLEKVFSIMSTFLRNKTISKTTPLQKENPFPQFNVASHKRPGIRLSFEYTTTLLSGEGGEGRTGTATMFRKMLSKYTIFSTVLSKIVGHWAAECSEGRPRVLGKTEVLLL